MLIDAANTGEWESCVKVDDLRLPDNWAAKAYIGLTATTGALADNHDILSLKTYSDAAVMEQDEQKEKLKENFALPDTFSIEAKLVS